MPEVTVREMTLGEAVREADEDGKGCGDRIADHCGARSDGFDLG